MRAGVTACLRVFLSVCSFPFALQPSEWPPLSPTTPREINILAPRGVHAGWQIEERDEEREFAVGRVLAFKKQEESVIIVVMIQTSFAVYCRTR